VGFPKLGFVPAGVQEEMMMNSAFIVKTKGTSSWGVPGLGSVTLSHDVEGKEHVGLKEKGPTDPYLHRVLYTGHPVSTS